ncbi:MAG: DUF4384 domain-containing protein [Gemmatimonadota bacterium]
MLTLLAALLAAAPGPVGTAGSPVVQPISQATVRITLNGGDYAPGDRVRVQVEPSQDGYLVVFRVDGDGRIRVLFPLDPDLDPFVRGGKRYELRGRGERETFLADDRGGSGIIYAALSRQPLAFGPYAVNDHWDYDALRLRDQDSDPEADLGAIVRRMGDNGRFDYDVTSYRVHETRVIVAGGGRSYDPNYDPYWSCLSCGWGYGRGTSIGISFGSRYNNWYGYPAYGDPWSYNPWGYDPYAYDSYFGYYGYPYYGSRWNYPGQYRPITVVNLPRPVTPNSPYGVRARSRQPINAAGLFAPDLTRGMRPESRPGGSGSNGGVDRGSYDTRGRQRNDDAPRSRPASGSDRRESPPQSSPPPSSRPGSSAPPPRSGSSGSDRARRRPEMSADLTPRVFEPAVERRQFEAPQPIFREPRREEAPADRSRPDRSSSSERPVYREPARTERASPPPQQSAPPRVERPSAPPPAAPATPSSGGDRARRRP